MLLIIAFLTVIIFTIGFIAFHANFILSLKSPQESTFDFSPMIVERAYKAHDFAASFLFETKESLLNMNHYREPSTLLIMDEKHKAYIIDKFTRGLAKEMIEGGFVEIKQTEDNYNPFMSRIDMRVKVYKPE